MNQPNLPDFQPYGQKPCSTEIAGKPFLHGAGFCDHGSDIRLNGASLPSVAFLPVISGRDISQLREALECTYGGGMNALREPVGWEYQHSETGRITVCINDGVNDRESFERMNPRHSYIGPLYRHPAARVEVDDAMVERFASSFYARGVTYEPERIRAAIAAALEVKNGND